MCVQCSHASVGLTQARPNYTQWKLNMHTDIDTEPEVEHCVVYNPSKVKPLRSDSCAGLFAIDKPMSVVTDLEK